MKVKKKVAIVGTHGVPARYGGFETLADFLCQNLSYEFNFTVYCNSKKYSKKDRYYFDAKLYYLPIDASGFQGIIYDVITFIHALFTSDIIIYLSPVGSGFITFLNILFRRKLIINHGGLNEWEREKLNAVQKKWAFLNHKIAAKNATINIADNEIYKQSIADHFNTNSIVIRYGGDHVITHFENTSMYRNKYQFVQKIYALSVSRAQVDNNIHIVLETFKNFNKFPIVLISNWEVSKYGRDLYHKYKDYPNIILLNAIYDKEELDYIRSNAYLYIHSHSRCGTAPSLVEAMNFGIPIISYDVPTNRETTENKAIFFTSSIDLNEILNNLDVDSLVSNSREMFSISKEKYTWKLICNQYKQIILDVN